MADPELAKLKAPMPCKNRSDPLEKIEKFNGIGNCYFVLDSKSYISRILFGKKN